MATRAPSEGSSAADRQLIAAWTTPIIDSCTPYVSVSAHSPAVRRRAKELWVSNEQIARSSRCSVRVVDDRTRYFPTRTTFHTGHLRAVQHLAETPASPTSSAWAYRPSSRATPHSTRRPTRPELNRHTRGTPRGAVLRTRPPQHRIRPRPHCGLRRPSTGPHSPKGSSINPLQRYTANAAFVWRVSRGRPAVGSTGL